MSAPPPKGPPKNPPGKDGRPPGQPPKKPPTTASSSSQDSSKPVQGRGRGLPAGSAPDGKSRGPPSQAQPKASAASAATGGATGGATESKPTGKPPGQAPPPGKPPGKPQGVGRGTPTAKPAPTAKGTAPPPGATQQPSKEIPPGKPKPAAPTGRAPAGRETMRPAIPTQPKPTQPAGPPGPGVASAPPPPAQHATRPRGAAPTGPPARPTGTAGAATAKAKPGGSSPTGSQGSKGSGSPTGSQGSKASGSPPTGASKSGVATPKGGSPPEGGAKKAASEKSGSGDSNLSSSLSLMHLNESNSSGSVRSVTSKTSSQDSRGKEPKVVDFKDEPMAEKKRIVTRPTLLHQKQAVYKPSQARQVKLMTNYFSITLPPSWKLWQYDVSWKPDVDSAFLRKVMINKHCGKDKPPLHMFMFDGKMLWSPHKYVKGIGEAIEVTCTDDKATEGSPKIYTAIIRMTKELSNEDHQTSQFWNIVLNKSMEALNLDRLGRNYFDSRSARILQRHNLEVWPGYTTSIRDHENGIMVCCETSSKVIRKETAYDVMAKIQRSPGNSVNRIKAALIGATVLTRFNNKTYRIDDIDFDLSMATSTFKKNDVDITYCDYFATRWGIKLKYPKTPGIVSNPREADYRRATAMNRPKPTPCILPPELCTMTGLTDEQKGNFNLMNDVHEHTRLKPSEKILQLKKFSERMHVENPDVSKTLHSWGMKMERKPMSIDSHLLRAEQIEGGQGSKPFIYDTKNADWSACFRKWTLSSAVNCSVWAIVCPKKFKNEAENFCKELLTVSAGMGFSLSSNFGRFYMEDERPATYITEIDKVLTKKPTMIMCVVANNRTADLYNTIKKKLYCQHAVPSQVMTHTVLKKEKGLKSVATKVAVQMAAKLGAEPWTVSIPAKKVMVVGFDSYHDSSQAGASIGALVATTNSHLSRFFSTCMHMTSSTKAEEVSNMMSQAFKTALQRYYQDNMNEWPARVIFYRDGVGEGQIEYLLHHEIGALRNVFKELKQEIKLTFVVVSKRINTRFFLQPPKDGEPYDNPHSGTVVDSVITLPERYDFFLVSQSVRHGTVNPTSYNVITDESGLTPAQLQGITYKMCHLYFNWPGTVRVPSVCQYAHKLAFMVGQNLHQSPKSELNTLLYYL